LFEQERREKYTVPNVGYGTVPLQGHRQRQRSFVTDDILAQAVT
jgi:hypothetical protein